MYPSLDRLLQPLQRTLPIDMGRLRWEAVRDIHPTAHRDISCGIRNRRCRVSDRADSQAPGEMTSPLLYPGRERRDRLHLPSPLRSSPTE